MDTGTKATLREQLLLRRNDLRRAVEETGEVKDLTRLLQEVDRALSRMDAGAFGQCEICREDVAEENLFANPLMRYCLCELDAEQQRSLESDLGLASRIQAALLPAQDLRVGGWEAHYRYCAAGPVSGDYCDLLECSGDAGDLFFVVGDVSGKGVAASLVMAHLNASFRSLLSLDLQIQELLERTNRLLLDSTIASHYATLVCGRAQSSGEIEMCNAGHLPALIVRRGRVDRVESIGLPIGMFPGQSYEVKLVHLDPGDTLFLCTDGVTEARSIDGDEQDYGVERIAGILSEFYAYKPRDLVDTCLADLDAFLSGARPRDDVTVMVLRRL